MTTRKQFQLRDRGTICDNPWRRLLAAVVVQACRDYFTPISHLSLEDRESAAAFLWSETGRNLLAYFLGLPQQTVQVRMIEAKGKLRRIPKR